MYDRLAVNILNAVESGNPVLLEWELGRSVELCRRIPAPSLDSAERLELLEAVAGQMRSALGRMRRRLTDHLEGAEVQIGLLRHLAAG